MMHKYLYNLNFHDSNLQQCIHQYLRKLKILEHGNLERTLIIHTRVYCRILLALGYLEREAIAALREILDKVILLTTGNHAHANFLHST